MRPTLEARAAGLLATVAHFVRVRVGALFSRRSAGRRPRSLKSCGPRARLPSIRRLCAWFSRPRCFSGRVSDLGGKGAGGLGALDVAHVFMHSCSVGSFLGGREAFAATVFGAGNAKGAGAAE